MTVGLIYVVLFVGCFFAVSLIRRFMTPAKDFTSLKTVTFGDESAVRADRWGSILSVAAIIMIWGAFTGSAIAPIKAPGPFVGTTSFTYTVEGPDGTRDDATVTVAVGKEVAPDVPEISEGDGPALNDAAAT